MFTFQQLVAYLEDQGGGPEGEPRQELPNLQGKVLVMVVEDSVILRKNICELLDDLNNSQNLPIKIAAPDRSTDVKHVQSLLSPENLSRLIEELNLQGVICLLDNDLRGLNGEDESKRTMGFQIAKNIWQARRSGNFPNLNRVKLIGASSNPFPAIYDSTNRNESFLVVDDDPQKLGLDSFIWDGSLEDIIKGLQEIPNVSDPF